MNDHFIRFKNHRAFEIELILMMSMMDTKIIHWTKFMCAWSFFSKKKNLHFQFFLN